MNKKVFYTSDDWLEERINDKQAQSLHADFIRTSGERGLSLKEWRKIQALKREAADWAVEIFVSNKKDYAKRKINEAKDPENWLRLEVERVEKFISDHQELEKAYEEDKTHAYFIDAHKYKRYKKCYETFQNGGFASILTPGKGNEWSRLQQMYGYKEYLPYLKELRENLDVLLYSKKDNPPDPFDVLVSGVAIRCIELFIEEDNVSEQNQEIAKSFLAAAEIMAKNGNREEIIESRTGTAREIAEQPYFNNKELPTERTTGGRWLKTYLENYRGEELFGT